MPDGLISQAYIELRADSARFESEGTDAAEKLAQHVQSKLDGAMTKVKEAVTSATAHLSTKFSESGSKMSTSLDDAASKIRTKMDETATSIDSKVGGAFTKVGEVAAQSSTHITERFSSTGAHMTASFTESGSKMRTAMNETTSKIDSDLRKVETTSKEAASGMSSHFKNLGMLIGGALSVGVITEFASKAADRFKEVGAEILKLQRYTGESAVSMSKLRFAAEESGVGADKLAKSMQFLSKNVAAGKPIFDELGVATLDSKGKILGLDSILLNVADKFKNMPNGVEKTSAAIAIFGKAGADMIPMLNRGRDGLIELENEAAKYGQILTDKNLAAIKASTMAHREQTAAMQGLQLQIGQNVLPLTTQLTKELTDGLLKVMPLIAAVMNGAVIPAFSVIATVLGATTSFLTSHTGAAKVLAVVLGTVLVPALIAWGVAQAQVLAINALNFVLGLGATAVRAAASIGLMTGSLEAGTVALTSMGIAVSGAVAIIGVLIMQYMHMQDAAKSEAEKIVSSAKSSADAVTELTAKQAQYRKEMDSGTNVFGVHISLLDSSAKKGAEAAAGYKATTAQLKLLAEGQKQSGDVAVQAIDAVDAALTSQGLKMQTLGGATKLTTDQIDALAASMHINLEKATSTQIDQMVIQAERLAITSDASLRLKDDIMILSNWTDDAAKKTTAFHDALDALVGSQTSTMNATIAYQQSLADLATKLTGVKYSTDLTTQAGRDQQRQIANTVDATVKMIETDQKSGATLDQLRPQIAAHVQDLTNVLSKAGLTSEQIGRLLEQYHLTPGALAQVTPIINDQAGAFRNLAGSIASAVSQYNNAVSAGNAAAAAAVAASGALNSVVGPVANRPTATSVLGHRAEGGPVIPGLGYLIGEKGPEIKMFDTPGTILPTSVVSALSRFRNDTPVRAPGPSVSSYTTATSVGPVVVQFHGAMPTKEQAYRTGVAAGQGVADVLASRSAGVAAQTA